MIETHDSGHRTSARPTPGVTLKAVASMAPPQAGGQETFTREQVAYIAALAYASGANSDAALSPPFAPLPVTPEQRVQQRIADMEVGAQREREWWAARLAIRPLPPIEAVQPMGLMTHHLSGRRLPEPREVPSGEVPDPAAEWPEVAAPGSGRPKW